MIEPKTNDELKDIIKTHVLNKKILLNEIDVSNLTDLSGVFSHFEFKYEYGSIENWNVSNVRNFHSMFYKAKNIWFDFKKWNMTNAVDCSGMFSHCYDFEGKGLEYWNFPKLKNANHMFFECQNFDVDVSNWNMQNIKNLNTMFSNCHKFRGIGLNKWNITITNESNISLLFSNCYKLDADFSNWKVNAKIDITEVFLNCHNFKGKGLEKWNIEINIGDGITKDKYLFESAFKNCYNLQNIPNIKIKKRNDIFEDLNNVITKCYSIKKIKKFPFVLKEYNYDYLIKIEELPYEIENIDIFLNEKQFPNIKPFETKNEIFTSRRHKAKSDKNKKSCGFHNLKKVNLDINGMSQARLATFIKFESAKEFAIGGNNYYRLKQNTMIIDGNAPNCIIKIYLKNKKEFVNSKNIFLHKNFEMKYFCHS